MAQMPAAPTGTTHACPPAPPATGTVAEDRGSVAEAKEGEGDRAASVPRAGGPDCDVHQHVVGKRPSPESGATYVPLIEVFDAPEWRDAVAAAGCDTLHLIRCRGVELDDLGVRVLSYRWATLLQVDCAVLVPGAPSYTEAKKRTLAIDALDVLRRECVEGDTHVWVDFLSHLDVPAHRAAVLNSMGTLYCERTVLPHYLTLFVEETEAEESLADAARAVQSAMRRGWIQQEIGYGALDEPMVLKFLATAIRCGDFGGTEHPHPPPTAHRPPPTTHQ